MAGAAANAVFGAARNATNPLASIPIILRRGKFRID
jgi:hypothetical protein